MKKTSIYKKAIAVTLTTVFALSLVAFQKAPAVLAARNDAVKPANNAELAEKAEEANMKASLIPPFKTEATMIENIKTKQIKVDIYHGGAYLAKISNFYGRKITGINPDGTYILGNWELLDGHTNEAMGVDEFWISGDYVMFAYSLDIVWGTDFPYSGVFWDDPYTSVNEIEIIHQGLCRNVSVTISVDQKTIYYCYDSPSHSEWKPW